MDPGGGNLYQHLPFRETEIATPGNPPQPVAKVTLSSSEDPARKALHHQCPQPLLVLLHRHLDVIDDKLVRSLHMASGRVGEHLADQLMLPMALAGGGQFSTSSVSQHALTNAAVIGRFLPVSIGSERERRRHVCTVAPACKAG